MNVVLYLGLWAVNPSYICDPKKTHFKILIMHHGAIISDSKCICYSDQVTRKRNSHCFSMSMVYQSTFVPFRIHREKHLSETNVSHFQTHTKNIRMPTGSFEDSKLQVGFFYKKFTFYKLPPHAFCPPY